MKATFVENVPVLPAGIYPARFDGISQESNDGGEFLLWKFTADDGTDLVEITGTTSLLFTTGAKSVKWLAGMGVDTGIGKDVDFDTLIGTECQLVITINDKHYSRIDNILPKPVGKGK